MLQALERSVLIITSVKKMQANFYIILLSQKKNSIYKYTIKTVNGTTPNLSTVFSPCVDRHLLQFFSVELF